MKNISKNIFKMLITASVLLACNTGVFAQTSAIGTSDAAGAIVKPITITNTAALDFGTVISSAAGGTVTMDTAGSTGTRSLSGVTTYVGAGARTPGVAAFSVSGEPSYSFSISTPSGFNVSDGSSHTMAVGSFINAASGTLSSLGAATFKVGAVLTVGALQTSGTYTSTGGLSLTVAYE